METTEASKVYPYDVAAIAKSIDNGNKTNNCDSDSSQALNHNDPYSCLELTNWKELEKLFASMDASALLSQFG